MRRSRCRRAPARPGSTPSSAASRATSALAMRPAPSAATGEAADFARAQGARMWELRAALSLARHEPGEAAPLLRHLLASLDQDADIAETTGSQPARPLGLSARPPAGAPFPQARTMVRSAVRRPNSPLHGQGSRARGRGFGDGRRRFARQEHGGSHRGAGPARRGYRARRRRGVSGVHHHPARLGAQPGLKVLLGAFRALHREYVAVAGQHPQQLHRRNAGLASI